MVHCEAALAILALLAKASSDKLQTATHGQASIDILQVFIVLVRLLEILI